MRNTFWQWLILLPGLILVHAVGASTAGPVYSSPDLDTQPAVLRTAAGRILLVIERLSGASGDLWVTSSDDNGATWAEPKPAIATSRNERHPALAQLPDNSFALFYLVDQGSNTFRIHRATSTDGSAWVDRGALELGWITGGEINPSVIRAADQSLIMVYHRLGGSSYLARSTDGGATWDTLRTQISVGNAALPRIAQRAGDGQYVVVYQVNPGNNNLDLYARVTNDPYTWNGPQIPVSIADNSHDAQPVALADGRFLVAYAQQKPGAVFDIYYRTSADGAQWSNEIPVTSDTDRYDVQPHPLVDPQSGNVQMFWSRQQSAQPYGDHDIWADRSVALPPAFVPIGFGYLPVVSAGQL